MIRGTGIDSTIKVCIQSQGANSSTNFFDVSQYKNTITPQGSVQISNAQYKFVNPGKSIVLNGTTDYLVIGSSADLNIGSGDGSISFFWYPTSTARQFLFEFGRSPNRYLLDFSDSNGNPNQKLTFYNSNTVVCSESTVSINQNAWNYICVSKSGSSVKIYTNGSQVASGTSATFVTPSGENTLGAYDGGGGTHAFYMRGYIDRFVVIKGVAIDGTIVPKRRLG